MPSRRHIILTVGVVLHAGPALAQSSADIDELVVTAQRRPEPVRSVPITMSALSGERLEQLSISRLPDVAGAIAGVQMQAKKGAGLPNFVIRGAGLLDYNPNNAAPTAVYVDEVYLPSPAMAEAPLFDIERVEVMKGPQGGLYGRDTSGGAVHMVTRRPRFDGGADGYLSLGYGRWDRATLEGADTFTLGSRAAVRVAALYQDGDGGWQRSLADGRAWGAPERAFGRLRLRLAPTDRLDVDLKLEAGWDGSEAPLGRSIAAYAPGLNFCPAVQQGRRDDSACLTLSQALRLAARQPASPSAGLQTPDGSLTLSRAVNRLANQNRSAVLSATYALGTAQLSSITAVGRFRYGQNTDFAASVDRLALQTQRTDIDTFSQELRLVSTNTSRLRWMLGAVWARDDLTEARSIDLRDNRLASQSFGIADASRAFLQLAYAQDSRYAALYGQVSWRASDTLGLSADLRYADQEKRYHDGFVGVARPYITRLSDLQSRYELKSHWSGKAAIDWRPRPGVLAYASVAKGYKSGGIFGGFNQIAAQVDPFREETVWAYEAGLRSAWLEDRLRLDGAVFHYDYSDAQGFTNVASPGARTATFPLLTNVGAARHDGVEFEVTARPIAGLTLQAGGAWLDARFAGTTATSASPEQIQVPLDGRRRPFAPRWSGFASARYEADLTPDLGAAVQVDANARTRLTFPVTPVERALGGVPGYTLVNARATLALRPHGMEIALWARNLTDQRYRLDVGSDGLGSFIEIYAEPRSYGVEVKRRW